MTSLKQTRENLTETLNQLYTQNNNMSLLLNELLQQKQEVNESPKQDISVGGIVEEIQLISNSIHVQVNIMRENESKLRKIVYGEQDTAQSYMTASTLEDMRGRYL